ncbi:MCE family protein [Aeromicrobium sp. Leaf350]|uniref:MCE family protein n=1 Tax=Aeromicrobium sp. Leaf350 TaxID=2876565 RepID=UPI001E482EBC|nr:MCE family protein [Aeromicrobium sp. Leaf350]
MKPFRERNHTIIGIVGFAVIALMLIGAFRADRLPIIGGGDTYKAEFSEIGGLRPGDEVRIAGVRVGKVDDIELAGDKVVVSFRITGGSSFGPDTGAAIRIRTLLGASYLALTPEGKGDMKENATIPLSRTKAPYDVVQAFSDLATTTGAIDTEQLATALTTVGDIAAGSVTEFGDAIVGLSDLSANLAARDQQINDLLTGLDTVSGTLASRNAEIDQLFTDASTLFDAVVQRRDAIHTLLVSTQEISTELTALVDSTRADLKPALDQLQSVTDTLVRNEASLDELLRVSPTFLRLFSEALGTGPWFDNFLGIGTDLTLPSVGGTP